MPKKNEVTKKEEAKKVDFLEFEMDYPEGERKIHFSGRIYPAKESKGIERSFVSLKIDNLFDIQSTFVETKNNYFVSFPQYQDKDKNYKSYVYVEKDSFFAHALEVLAELLYSKKKEF